MKFKASVGTVICGILASTLLLVVANLLVEDITKILIAWAIGIGIIIAIKVTEVKEIYLKFIMYGIVVSGIVMWMSFCITENLWYDEAYTAAMVSHSFKDMIAITAMDVHPPLYYIIAKVFYNLSGDHIQALKGCSAVFMIGYLVICLVPIRKIVGDKIVTWQLFFSVFMPIMLLQATNVRMYSVSIFFFTLTCLYAYYVVTKPTFGKYLLFGLFSIASMYVHTFTLVATFVVYIIVFVLILWQRKYKSLIPYFSVGLVVAITYLPWLMVQWKQVIKDAGNAFSPFGLGNLWDVLVDWFSSKENPIFFATLFSTILLFALIIIGTYKSIKNKDYLYLIGIIPFGVVTFLGIGISLTVTPCYMGRYSFAAIGFLWLFMAYGMVQCKNNSIKLIVAITLVFICALSYQDEFRGEYDSGLHTYKEFVEENMQSGDVIMAPDIHSLMTSIYFPDFTYLEYGHKEDFNPFQNVEAYTEYSQLDSVKGQIWYVSVDKYTPEEIGFVCDKELVKEFDYMYYHIRIYKIIKYRMQ